MEKMIKQEIDTLRDMIKESVGGSFIDEVKPIKNDGFIYDIASNTVFFEDDKEQCAEFISYENGSKFDEIHSHAIVDFALNDIANVRRCCLDNDYGQAKEIVKRTLDCAENNGDGFYYLPDNTDTFSNNIKSGFSGYTYVWRSIAKAYSRYYDEERQKKDGVIDFHVVDLFEKEPVKISIRAEIIKKYGNEVMFTRYKKEPLKAMLPLSYVNVARAFWEEYFKKRRLNISDGKDGKAVVDRLISCDATYNLLCGGRPFDLVYNDQRYAVGVPEAKTFLNNYLLKHKATADRLLKDYVIYGNFIAIAYDLLPDYEYGYMLSKYKERRKKGIPLWIETLPKLTLDRIVNKEQKRLGEYTLVEADKTVENLFKPYVINCPEKLTLPAGHEEIRFPLTIGGMTDKKYIATVKMDEKLETAKEFDVRLVYDFNNENSYQFILSNEEAGEKRLIIEEGEPERKELPFVMEFDDYDETLTEIYDEIYNGLCDMEEAVDKYERDYSRRYYENGDNIEMQWEYGMRVACRRVFLAWVGLPYERKEQKNFGEDIDQLVTDVLDKLNDLAIIDDMELGYKIHAVATLALISSDVECDYSAYFSIKGCRKLESAFITTVLCNSNVSDTSGCIKTIVKRYGNDDERICRTFSLPLLANGKLLNHICEHENEYKLLSHFVGRLSRMFDKLCGDLDKKEILPKTLRQIRDAYELTLSLLKLRELDNKHWPKVKGIESVLPSAEKLEKRLYDKLSEEVSDPSDYFELVEEYADREWDEQNLNCKLLVSRVSFKSESDSGDLSLMHPLALTAITYLQGNPDIHIIGCGLRDDD